MGSIFILVILILAVFVCISKTVFTLAAQTRPKDQLSGLHKKQDSRNDPPNIPCPLVRRTEGIE